jgi:hypothetical protein
MITKAAYAMTEDRGTGSLQAGLQRLIDAYGLWGYHPQSSYIGGWPDWVILGPRGGLFRELKSERGTLTPAQRDVGARLYRAGFNWAVWRPRDLLDGTIERQLQAIMAGLAPGGAP